MGINTQEQQVEELEEEYETAKKVIFSLYGNDIEEIKEQAKELKAEIKKEIMIILHAEIRSQEEKETQKDLENLIQRLNKIIGEEK